MHYLSRSCKIYRQAAFRLPETLETEVIPMKKKSFWCTLLTVVIAAAAAAAIAYLLYCYRENVKAALEKAKEKGKKLLNSCCEDFSDFADL